MLIVCYVCTFFFFHFKIAVALSHREIINKSCNFSLPSAARVSIVIRSYQLVIASAEPYE